MSYNFLKNILSKTKCNKGAIFGLDARITLIIFTTLSLVVGVYVVNHMPAFRAQAFSKELSGNAEAATLIQKDLHTNIFNALSSNNKVNIPQQAFSTLFIKDSIKPELQKLWLGPYVTNTTTVHPNYGNITLIQAPERNITSACIPQETCFIWVSYSKVASETASELNTIFDGNETIPEATGRVRWEDNLDGSVKLYFNLVSSLS